MAAGSALAAGAALGLRGVNAQELLKPAPTAEDLLGGPNWTPPDLSGKSLRMWGLSYAPHVEKYKLLIAQFKELTGAEIVLEPQDDIVTAVNVALAGRNPPDVMCLMARMSDGLVKLGGLLDVTDAVYGDLGIDMDKWWFPEGIEAYTWGGRLYGVPCEANATNGASVRVDLLAAAGSAADGLWPGDAGVQFESYDQLFSLAAALQQKSGDSVKVWGQNRQGWEILGLASMLRQQGIQWYDEQSGAFNFENDACVNALEHLVTRPYGLGIESKLATDNTVAAFVAGTTAIGIGNIGAAGEGTKVGFPGTNFVVPSIVAGEPSSFVGEAGWGFEVPLRAKNQDAAIEFLKFMTTYNAQHTWSQIYGGAMPALRPLFTSNIYEGDSDLKKGQRRLLTACENTTYMGHGFDPQIYDMVGTIVSSLREGSMDARQTAAELQRQLTAQQARFNEA